MGYHLMVWQQFQFFFLFFCVVGWIVALVKLQQAEDNHPDQKARKDAFHLFTLLFASAILIIIRERLVNPSTPYWVLNGLLLPISLMVILKVLRLVKQYQRERR